MGEFIVFGFQCVANLEHFATEIGCFALVNLLAKLLFLNLFCI